MSSEVLLENSLVDCGRLSTGWKSCMAVDFGKKGDLVLRAGRVGMSTATSSLGRKQHTRHIVPSVSVPILHPVCF